MRLSALRRELVSTLRGFAPKGWMRSEWDRRAREDAKRFIACGTSETDEAFWDSGRRDLEDRVLRDVELDAAARTLEIGCGMGRILRPMSERVEKAFGVDISAGMVAHAREALQDRENVGVSVTDGTLSEFPDASLDFVYSYIVFQHIPSKRAVARYIREAARVLKGSGVFRFQVDGRERPNREVPDTWLGVWYDAGELRAELRRRRFHVAAVWGEGTHYLWMTARRKGGFGRPESQAVRVRRRRWNREALEAALARMGHDASQGARRILAGRWSLREASDKLLREGSNLDPETFVRRAYEVLLAREADVHGLAFYSKEISAGIPRSNTVDCLLGSSELEDRLRPLDAA